MNSCCETFMQWEQESFLLPYRLLTVSNIRFHTMCNKNKYDHVSFQIKFAKDLNWWKYDMTSKSFKYIVYLQMVRYLNFCYCNYSYMSILNDFILRRNLYSTNSIFKVTFHRLRWLRVTGLDKIWIKIVYKPDLYQSHGFRLTNLDDS